MARYTPLFYRGAPASIPQVVAHIQRALTEEDPEYTPLRQRMPPASIPEIVAHIQEYLIENVFETVEDLGEDIAAYIEAHPDIVGVLTVNGSTGNVTLDASDIPIETGEDPTVAGAISYLSSQLALLVADAVLSVNGVTPDDSHDVTITGANIAQDANTTKKLSEAFGPASASAAGSKGLVPAPQAGDENRVLSGSGAWVDQPTGTVQTVCSVGPNAQGNVPLKGSDIPLQSMSLQTVAQAIAAVGAKTGSDIPTSTTDNTPISTSLSNLNDHITDLTTKLTLKQPTNLCHSDSDWTSGAYVDNGSGAITSNSSLAYSAKMPVNEGDVIRLYDYYGGSFGVREIRSVAAYDSSDTFVRTQDSLGWKVYSYTVPSGVAYIILSAPIASQYMVVANTTVSAYEAWFEPYYIATFDFISNALENGELSTYNLKNGYACALPKTKFRQTVGIPCTWYKASMITPQSATIYVNAGYSRTTNDVNTFSWNAESAYSSSNGFLWYAYDTLMNLLYKFDNNTGYGAPTVTTELNLSDCSLLAIGDSTVDQDHMTGKLLSYFSDNNHTITLLGTLGSQSEPLNRNEGRAGWTTSDYMANTTKNGYTNPFYNPTTEAFDFSYYMTQQGYSGVDFVVIQLGINDLYPKVPRTITEPNYSAIWGNIQTMIDSILAYNSGIKIIINLPTTPNSDPTAHSIAPFLYLNYVINYNNYALDRILSLSESKVRASYCHLILDPSTDINDNVHPKVAGYNKMALEIVNQINCWQNGV